jgi:hypothetical protein
MMFKSFGRDISKLDNSLSPDQLVMGTVPLGIVIPLVKIIYHSSIRLF